MLLFSDMPAAERIKQAEAGKSLPPWLLSDQAALEMEMFKAAIEQAKRNQK